MKCTVDNVFSAKVDTIIRRLRPLERAKRKWNAAGVWNAQMERREAPYPYSKMCNVCNVCNALSLFCENSAA